MLGSAMTSVEDPPFMPAVTAANAALATAGVACGGIT